MIDLLMKDLLSFDQLNKRLKPAFFSEDTGPSWERMIQPWAI